MTKEAKLSNIKMAIQNFKEASECLKYDKNTKRYAYELEGSAYDDVKVDMTPFCEKIATALGRFRDEIVEYSEFHMPEKVKEDLLYRITLCVNMIIDDEGVRNAILHGNNEYDGKTLRLCDLIYGVERFEDLGKIYHTRVMNVFKNLDKFDPTSVKRIKRRIIKQFREDFAGRIIKTLKGDVDPDDGVSFETPAQRIESALIELNEFSGYYDRNSDDDYLTEEMVNDSSLDIDVSKVPLELVNNFEEDESKEETVEIKGPAEQIKTESVETEPEKKTVQLSKW